MINIVSYNKRKGLILLLIFFYCVSLVLSGCGRPPRIVHPDSPKPEKGGNSSPTSVRDEPPKFENKDVNPPEIVRLLITIRNWEIYNCSVLNNWLDDYGKFKYSGRFILHNKIIYKFVSEKFSKYYWFADVPNEMQGKFTIIATRNSDNSIVDKLIDPPSHFDLFIKVRNGKFLIDFVVAHDSRWGLFSVYDVHAGILHLRNEWYPGKQWAAQLPKKEEGDGDFTLHVLLRQDGK